MKMRYGRVFIGGHRRSPYAGIIQNQVNKGPPHTTVALSARLHRTPPADDKIALYNCKTQCHPCARWLASQHAIPSSRDLLADREKRENGKVLASQQVIPSLLLRMTWGAQDDIV
jgi:hypothetical protein